MDAPSLVSRCAVHEQRCASNAPRRDRYLSGRCVEVFHSPGQSPTACSPATDWAQQLVCSAGNHARSRPPRSRRSASNENLPCEG